MANTNEINAGADVMPSLKRGPGGGGCVGLGWHGHSGSGTYVEGDKVIKGGTELTIGLQPPTDSPTLGRNALLTVSKVVRTLPELPKLLLGKSPALI